MFRRYFNDISPGICIKLSLAGADEVDVFWVIATITKFGRAYLFFLELKIKKIFNVWKCKY